MKIFKYKILFLVISVIIAGFILSKTSIFSLIILSIVWVLILSLILIIGFYDVIKKKKKSKYPFIFFIILTLSILISLPFRKFQLDRKKDKAEILVVKLENHKKKNNKYPKSIKELNLDFETDYINYSTDSLNSSFFISYDVDGWHTEKYNSNEKKWIGGD